MPTLLTEKHPAHCSFILNRPKVINALDGPLFKALQKNLSKVEGKPLILSGAGEKGFCAGADLKALKGMNLEELANYLDEAKRAIDQLARFPNPTIALLHGYVLGGGLELALACDFLIADEETVLGMPETKIGLIPGFGGEKRLVARIGAAKAKELIFSGKNISASEALSMKLIDMVVKREFRDQVATTFAASFSPHLHWAKRAFAEEDSTPLFIEAFKQWKRRK